MKGEIEMLEQRIARQREELDGNLETLATRARALTDWRAQVDAHPLMAIGIAAGGGMLLAALLSPRRRARAELEPGTVRRMAPRSGVSEFLGDVRGALGAVASATAVEFLTEAIPGFHEHFGKGTSAAGS